MMCLGEVLGLGFDWESDGVGFEEGGLGFWSFLKKEMTLLPSFKEVTCKTYIPFV